MQGGLCEKPFIISRKGRKEKFFYKKSFALSAPRLIPNLY
jgi:hypothetical protein